jgi:hypothetical protein
MLRRYTNTRADATRPFFLAEPSEAEDAEGSRHSFPKTALPGIRVWG